MTGRGEQKTATLRFWEDYYNSHVEETKEWIVQPNEALLDKILPTRRRPLRLLEIGCGTSTLSRDVHAYLNLKNDDARPPSFPDNSLQMSHVVATDASMTCIDQIRRRDAAVLADGTLEYQTWNLTEPPPTAFHKYFDIVLDKGCLDTFLFRSRTRGPRAHLLLQTVLNHIYQCLTPHHHGQYILLSPRRKLKFLRDYPGFATVTRLALDPLGHRGDLDGRHGQKDETLTYVHTCSIALDHTFEPNDKKNTTVCDEITLLPTNDSTCAQCHLTFLDFRKGESIEGRGAFFWYRRWNGHCQHCRAS